MPKKPVTGESIVDLPVVSIPGILTPEEEYIINPDYDIPAPKSIWEMIIDNHSWAFIY